jgi:hypothetical protein
MTDMSPWPRWFGKKRREPVTGDELAAHVLKCVLKVQADFIRRRQVADVMRRAPNQAAIRRELFYLGVLAADLASQDVWIGRPDARNGFIPAFMRASLAYAKEHDFGVDCETQFRARWREYGMILNAHLRNPGQALGSQFGDFCGSKDAFLDAYAFIYFGSTKQFIENVLRPCDPI